MDNSTKISKLEGKVQPYTWGGSQFIPALLQQQNPDNKPFAEYWMGAHDNAPAVVTGTDGQQQPLNALLAAHPALLGKKVQGEFGKLPYLFKVLDVKDMLSIQVHPEKQAAIADFAAENAKGVALNAPHRNYKDDNHKPELMYALSEFWLLHGFKTADQLKQVLEATPELRFLLPVFGEGNYAALYKTAMEMDQQAVNEHLQPLVDRILPLYEKGALKRAQEDFWAARAFNTFCEPGRIDRGIFSIYFFNVVNLHPGEAIFQDAGILHAYLEGQNMEIMANSDNVLRGGLTNKHVDVQELMKHVRFEPIVPTVITGVPGSSAGEEIFPTPAKDFELHRITLKAGGTTTITSTTVDIFFVYAGDVDASAGAETVRLQQGEALLAVAGTALTINTVKGTEVFVATVPA
nr:mannose-6-phosphate isomerase, class I [Paraflavitalea sp. H1-2-19X]